MAESFARIFYRNSVNGGYLVPLETPTRLVEGISTGDQVELDVRAGKLKNLSDDKVYPLKPLGDAAEIIAAGGIFQYARKSGLIK